MPTSSITKQFTIKDKETCDRLIQIISESEPWNGGSLTAYEAYEKGKKLVANYYSLKDTRSKKEDKE